jgi:hypothetical protein
VPSLGLPVSPCAARGLLVEFDYSKDGCPGPGIDVIVDESGLLPCADPLEKTRQWGASDRAPGHEASSRRFATPRRFCASCQSLANSTRDDECERFGGRPDGLEHPTGERADADDRWPRQLVVSMGRESRDRVPSARHYARRATGGTAGPRSRWGGEPGRGARAFIHRQADGERLRPPRATGCYRLSSNSGSGFSPAGRAWQGPERWSPPCTARSPSDCAA